MRFCLWMGQRGVMAMIVEQFGLAMMPLCCLMASGFTSGMTKGTVGSMRKAEDAVLLVDGPEGGDGDDRGAIRIGDDAFVLLDGFGVYFGDDQGDGGVHAEGGGCGFACGWARGG